ncbi:MAG: DUF6802 family protein [Rhodococcus sp. (in: high G+C Gram-positive bacteria)]
MDIDEALLLGAGLTDPVGAEPDASSAAVAGVGGVSSFGANGVELFDVDGDSDFESRVSYTDAGMTVARDRDLDGVIDTFTTIGRGGHYQSWEILRAADGSARWEQTSEGEVFD